MEIKALITQSNYIPWKGFFDSMSQVDIVVLYDDMQFTRRDWRNRNLIITPQGLKWLTIPVIVKGKYFQKINETIISDKNWNVDHLNILKQNYRNSECYNDVKDWVEDLYLNCNFNYLTEINQYFIEKINQYLDINVKIIRSEQFVLAEDKTERLVNICKDLNVTDYFSGPAAKVYMNEDLFVNQEIKIHYFDYQGYPEYKQLNNEFEHGVSILDVIFNNGQSSKELIKKLF